MISNFKRDSDQERIINSYVEQAPEINDDTRFAKSIKQIHQLLDSLKIRHYFFVIPSKYSCASGDWSSPTFSSNVNAFLEVNVLPYINMDQAFKEYSNPERLFYKNDMHCTLAGNDLIAKEIMKIINWNHASLKTRLIRGLI